MDDYLEHKIWRNNYIKQQTKLLVKPEEIANKLGISVDVVRWVLGGKKPRREEEKETKVDLKEVSKALDKMMAEKD